MLSWQLALAVLAIAVPTFVLLAYFFRTGASVDDVLTALGEGEATAAEIMQHISAKKKLGTPQTLMIRNDVLKALRQLESDGKVRHEPSTAAQGKCYHLT